MGRTVKEILVSGRSMQEVRDEIHRWMLAHGIKPLEDREDFLKGRLGIQGNLGLTAPKYFEIFLKPKENGVMVRTEGWVGVWGAEGSFSKDALAGAIPRRKGWQVMEHLWGVLMVMSR
jgi:hypothetical protein